MDLMKYLLNRGELVGNKLLHDLRGHQATLSAVKGLRNGLIYGVRIRAPHALVMVFLFGQGTILERLLTILKLTRTHAYNLSRFVFGYKLLMGIMQKFSEGKKEWHALLAAAIVGYCIFGDDNSVNMQINMYLLSRITVGLARLAVDKGIIRKPDIPVFPLFAALVWGVVLWMFEYHEEVLQPSLRSSMTYLYKDSNVWTDIGNFLLRNK